MMCVIPCNEFASYRLPAINDMDNLLTAPPLSKLATLIPFSSFVI